ncbi:DUF3493-containing protein [Aureococcus anophagefferens]|nr:DUF3493-containing protein [Aureococcus anophagefferens]
MAPAWLAAIVLLCVAPLEAFVAPAARRTHVVLRAEPEVPIPPKPGKSISAAQKSKLLQEAQTPWRTVRTFFYGAFGLSATVGGITALAQTAASVAGQPDALPLSQCGVNVLVDAGVVAACLYGNSVDNGEAADITVADETAPLADDRSAAVRTLQRDAGQAVVVLGGPRAAVDDALLDALIQRNALR